MSEMERERFEELKEAYVLDALSEEERREFEEYLAAHPERQAEIDELNAVAGLLALSAEEHEPTPELRRRIMDTVRAEAVHPRASRRSWLARIGELLGTRNLALGAAALLVIGLFSWNMLLRGEVQDLQGQGQDVQARGSQTIVLRGPGVAQGAQAELVTVRDERVVLVARNMPAAPEDKTYQIWVINGGVPEPSGLFEPREDSVAAFVENSLHKADTVAVTVEPEGGSPKPTSNPILVAKV